MGSSLAKIAAPVAAGVRLLDARPWEYLNDE